MGISAAELVELVEAIAPEYIGETARITTFLEFAIQLHDASAFGAPYGHAMANYAAHLLTKAGGPIAAAAATSALDAGTSGPVTSRKAGDLATNYGATSGGGSSSSSATDAELSETKYGRAYLRIRDSRDRAGPLVFPVFP